MILRILSLLALLIVTVAAESPSSVTVYAWPLSASSPKTYAEISLSPDGTAIVKSTKPVSAKDGELVRVGLQDSSKAWSGVATSANSFKDGITQKITLHTDNDGSVAHISFSSFKAPEVKKGTASSAGLMVDVVPIQAGPEPVLNKPVVLNAEGKLDKPEADTRTFLQKYWWAIALFLVLQVVAGGGGKE